MIRLLCQSCGSKLKLPDYAAGKKAQCPECSAVFLVSPSSVPDTSRPTPNPGRQLEAAIEIDEEATVSRGALSPGKRSSSVAVEREEEDAVVELDLDDSPPPSRPNKVVAPPRADRPKKPKKKKKKNAAKSREPIDVPGWVWWTAGVGGVAALCVIAAVVAIVTGHTAALLLYSFKLGVMLPISTIILIISMVISSQLVGGIDFGEVHTAIAKAILLLFAVNVVSLVGGFGIFLSIPIWLFGLMYLFNLDFWETRFLLFINWVLNFAARYAMMAMIVSGLNHLPSTMEDDDHHPAIKIPATDHDLNSEPDDDQ
jgi:hypothetical protein